MNRRPQHETTLAAGDRLPPLPAGGTGCLPAPVPPDRSISEPAPGRKKNGGRGQAKPGQTLPHNALFVVRRNGEHHVIAESYFYKTDPYYTILALENAGNTVRPSSGAVLDAYVIPVCLERVRTIGVPVCEWGISQAYVPVPAVLYGLNYFATTAEYAVVRDPASAPDTIRHITNNGKYPFCFQKFPGGSEMAACTAIFGETAGACRTVVPYAKAIYDLFGIPLMRLVFIRTGSAWSLSSLSPLKYSELSDEERALLSAHLQSQEQV